MRRLILLLALLPAPCLAQDAKALMSALDGSVRAACANVVGVAVGRWNDKTTWRIDFDGSQTQTCASAAQAAMASFNPTNPPVFVPPTMTVTRLQAMVAMSRAGKLAQAQAWIGGQSQEVQLIWNSAPTFTRNSALMNSAATALGWSQSDLDNLFLAASQINP